MELQNCGQDEDWVGLPLAWDLASCDGPSSDAGPGSWPALRPEGDSSIVQWELPSSNRYGPPYAGRPPARKASALPCTEVAPAATYQADKDHRPSTRMPSDP